MYELSTFIFIFLISKLVVYILNKKVINIFLRFGDTIYVLFSH